jgi:hypothetical protein
MAAALLEHQQDDGFAKARNSQLPTPQFLFLRPLAAQRKRLLSLEHLSTRLHLQILKEISLQPVDQSQEDPEGWGSIRIPATRSILTPFWEALSDGRSCDSFFVFGSHD